MAVDSVTAAKPKTPQRPATAPTAPGQAAPATATGPAPTGPPAAVWAALTGNPGATAAAIAVAAGVSKTTARKALAELEAAGRAARIAGGHEGGKRTPDSWHPASPPGDADEIGGVAAEIRDALKDVTEAITSALEALEAGDQAAVLTAAEAIYTGSGRTRRLVRAAVTGRPRSASGQPRSQPGDLRDKVASHLTAHSDLEFTPHEIGKAIGHSAGAVANALDRLTALGVAVATCERPRRFTAAPTPRS